MPSIRPGATTVVALLLVGSITTKGQMKQRVLLYCIEYSLADGPEHTIVFSILTDLTSKETTENEKSMNQSESNTGRHGDRACQWRSAPSEESR